jgi:hypothetical protein
MMALAFMRDAHRLAERTTRLVGDQAPMPMTSSEIRCP